MNITERYTLIQGPEPIRRVEPIHMEESLPEVFGRERDLYSVSPESGIYEVGGAFFSKSGICRNRHGFRIPWNRGSSPFGKPERGLNWDPRVWWTTSSKLYGRVGVITHPRQGAYFHWLFDVLPRLALLQRSGISCDWLYIDQSSQFQRETLDLLDQKIPILNAAQMPSVQATEIVVPTAPSVSGVIPPWVCHWLRDELAVNCDADARSSERIYISRSLAGRGRVRNEEQLVNCLMGRGFKIIQSENFSIREQISIFKNAKIIVAPHGAGFSNSVFSKSGSAIIEIISNQYLNICFWTLSSQLGNVYAFQLAQPVDGEGGEARPDLVVDVEKLDRLLDRVEGHMS